jgi:hypothetical protein
VLQAGTDLSGFAGLPIGARISTLQPPVVDSVGLGLIRATVSGPGITADNNNGLLFRSFGSQTTLLRRTGVPVAELGNDKLRAFTEVVNSSATDHYAVSYLVKASAADGVTLSNDSGLLIMHLSGAITAFNAREGEPAFGGSGTFGQFRGRAATYGTVNTRFVAKFIPDNSTPRDAFFTTHFSGTGTSRYGFTQGDLAPGTVNGERLGAFTGATESASLGGRGLLRANLTNSPLAKNEGVWDTSTDELLLRKGQPIGGGISVARIIQFWPVNTAVQIVFHVKLAGTGVTALNNTALLLRQADGGFMFLMRTGSIAPGIGLSRATLTAINAVNVNPAAGRYVVLGTIGGVGVSTTNNQVLWTGRTTLGLDTSSQHLRQPTLLLRKGDRYGSTSTPQDTIRGLSLKPAVDTSGAHGRGLSQVVGESDFVLATIIGDRLAQETVVLEP